jgi:hypothetical protein
MQAVTADGNVKPDFPLMYPSSIEASQQAAFLAGQYNDSASYPAPTVASGSGSSGQDLVQTKSSSSLSIRVTAVADEPHAPSQQGHVSTADSVLLRLNEDPTLAYLDFVLAHDIPHGASGMSLHESHLQDPASFPFSFDEGAQFPLLHVARSVDTPPLNPWFSTLITILSHHLTAPTLT